MSDDDIFNRYSRDSKPKEEAAVDPAHDELFDRYTRTETNPETGRKRVYITSEKPRGDVADMSGFNNRMVSSIPLVGGLFDKATAATGAAIQPLVSEDAKKKSFKERYEENIALQNDLNKQYGEDHPIAAPIADLTGGAMAMGPISRVTVPNAIGPMALPQSIAGANIGARALGLEGGSLGAKAYQGALGGAGIAGADALIRGENPVGDGGAVNPLTVGAAGGFLGPVVGEGLAAAGNRLINALPGKRGELSGVNSVGREMLSNTIEGETPKSIAAAKDRYGKAGMLADVNQQTSDLAGGLADIPGPHKQGVREAYRDRASGQKDRILASLDKNTVPQVDITRLGNLIERDQQTASKPLYDQFRSTKVHPTDEIKALMPRLEAAGAFDKAEQLAGISGRPFERSFFTGGPQKDFPTTEAWDLVKRSLDSRISAALDATKPDKNLAGELLKLKKDMLGAIDKSEAGPVYKQAREKFAEYATLTEQMKEGGKTWERGNTWTDLKHEMSLLTPFEQAARRQGARDAVQNIIENSHLGDTTARNKLLTDAGRKKLEVLFGEKKAGALVKDLEAELNISEKNKAVVGGSPTSEKQARRDAVLPPKVENGYLRSIKLNEPATLVPDWMTPQAMIEGASAQRYANAHSQIGPLLTRSMDDPSFDRLVADISKERARRESTNQLMQARGRTATKAVAASLPGLENRLLRHDATQ